jgi:hypothetical protein
VWLGEVCVEVGAGGEFGICTKMSHGRNLEDGSLPNLDVTGPIRGLTRSKGPIIDQYISTSMDAAARGMAAGELFLKSLNPRSMQLHETRLRGPAVKLSIRL